MSIPRVGWRPAFPFPTIAANRIPHCDIFQNVGAVSDDNGEPSTSGRGVVEPGHGQDLAQLFDETSEHF